MEFTTFRLPDHGGDACHLVVVEGGTDIPFEIRRVYSFSGVRSGERRGRHAHKTLRQVLVCLQGSCRVLLDDGKDSGEFLLSEPTKGLYIGPSVWRELYDFTPDAVVLVLADRLYDESDYIRDYAEFQRWCGV